MTKRLALLWILTALSCSSAPSAPVPPLPATFEGIVVDRSGNRVAHAEIASFWRFDDGVLSAYSPITADEAGRFAGASDPRGPRVLVYSRDRALAAVHDVANGSPARIVLGPTHFVRGRFRFPELARPAVMTRWYREGDDQWLVTAALDDAPFALPLPPGRYAWDSYGHDVERDWGRVSLENDDEHIGGVAFEIAELASHIGGELPSWTVTEARGVPDGRTALSDFRGKWLLVEFWGFW